MKRSLAGTAACVPARQPQPAEIEEAVELELSARWGAVRRHPELTAFSHDGDPTAWCDLRLTIEIDEGLELPFEVEDAEVLEMLKGGAAGFAKALAGICEGLIGHASDLRASQAAMHARCEAFGRGLDESGLNLSVGWISLAPYDHWIDPRAVKFDIALEGLGQHLRRADLLGEAGLKDNLHEAFEHVLDEQRDRARLHSRVQSQKADGLADQIALTAIRSQPDPVAVFAAVMRDERVELMDGVSLYWSNGILRSRGDCGHGADLWRDQLELAGRWFSGPAVAKLVGGPASAVLEHPALAGIPVRAIHSDIVDGRPSSMVDLDVRIELFEASTGRSWPWPNPDDG